MKYLCIWLIKFYQKVISPLKRPCCRFTPSCSSYAVEAYRKRGFFVGTALTTWRILRCNPYCRGGYDPVPARGFRYRGPQIPPPSADCREDDGSESIASYEKTDAASAAEGAFDPGKENNS